MVFTRAIHRECSLRRLSAYSALEHQINESTLKVTSKVSGISDSLLGEIAPYFKFPKWVGESRQKNTGSSESISKLDLNTDQWKHSDRSMALVLCCPKESCTTKRDLRRVSRLGRTTGCIWLVARGY